MAESIIIHFNESDPSVVLRRIENRFGPSDDQTWRFPADDYLLLIESSDDVEAEYDVSELDQVCAMLGGAPTTTFEFEIRRSRSDDACDVLEQFVRVDLQGLNFLVNNMERLISCTELEGLGDFLECYRYQRPANQDDSGHPDACPE